MEQQLARVSGTLSRATDAAAQLPRRTDLDFFCSINPELEGQITDASSSLGELLRKMHRWTAGDDKDDDDEDDDDPREFSRRLAAPSAFSHVGDIVDQLLERADTYLDEYAGRVPIRTKENFATAAMDIPSTGRLPPHLENASIEPPQRSFTTKPDNRSGVPWSRTLKYGKPNATVPLGWRDPSWDTTGLVTGVYGAEGDPRLNPYHVEIQQTKIPRWVFDVQHSEMPESLNLENAASATSGGTFKWVGTAAELDELLAHLREDRVKEIAVDLEHNNKRSYLGIVCLMQISTRWGDWIVDTLADEVREHAEILNKVFTSPKKVLVFHGADHDILWLQRDLGLYVTALFDTYHATNVLNMPVHSLAYLLQRYVGFEADKRYQLADWRIRPLPLEMLFYARSDTHWLLYIYDQLRAELLSMGGPHAVSDVFERSKSTASKVYVKLDWDESGESRSGWRSLWLRRGGEQARAAPEPRPLELLNKEERLVRALHRWRDQVAREQDEGPQHILSDQSLIFLAFRAPETTAETLRVIPKSMVIARSRSDDITNVIVSESRAWTADSRKREEAAQAQLDSMNTETDDDLGETVASSSRQGIFGGDSTMSASGPSMFAGMKSIDSDGTLRGSSGPAPKSLFELPARLFHSSAPAPASVRSTLVNIRNECAQILGGLFGANTHQKPAANRMITMMGLDHVLGQSRDKSDAMVKEEIPAEEEHGDNDVEGDEAKRTNEIEAPQEELPESSPRPQPKSLAPKDTVVKVSKKERWSRDKKRQRKGQDGPQPKSVKREIEPFDYASATSVLDAPTEQELTPAPLPKTKLVSTARPRSAKQKSDVRRGNKSGTFAK